MHAFDPRYFAFVSRFVDTVTTDPLTQELRRLSNERRQRSARHRVAVAVLEAERPRAA